MSVYMLSGVCRHIQRLPASNARMGCPRTPQYDVVFPIKEVGYHVSSQEMKQNHYEPV